MSCIMTFFAGIVRFSSCFYAYINLFIWINLLYLGTKFLLIEMYNLFPYISHLSCTSNIWGGEVYLFLRKNCEKVCLSWRKVDFPSDSPNKTMIPEEIWTNKTWTGAWFSSPVSILAKFQAESQDFLRDIVLREKDKNYSLNRNCRQLIGVVISLPVPRVYPFLHKGYATNIPFFSHHQECLPHPCRVFSHPSMTRHMFHHWNMQMFLDH